MPGISDVEVVRLASDAGFDPDQLTTITAIALAEHRGSIDTRAVGRNTNGSTDTGVWQINSVHKFPPAQLLDPKGNAEAARRVYDMQGFGAWSVFRKGCSTSDPSCFLHYRVRAARAAKKAGKLTPSTDTGGNWASGVSDAVTGLPDKIAGAIGSALAGLADLLWPILLSSFGVAFGLALVGFGVVKLVGSSGAGEVAKGATPIIGAAAKAARSI